MRVQENVLAALVAAVLAGAAAIAVGLTLAAFGVSTTWWLGCLVGVLVAWRFDRWHRRMDRVEREAPHQDR